MIECSELSGRMPDVVSGRSEWSPLEMIHVTECADCAAEWRLVRVGSTLHSGLAVETEPIVRQVLARLHAAAQVGSVPRLRWRTFAFGLAAAASVALAVWVPSRSHQAVVETLPSRIGPLLPRLSNVTSEQLYGISLASEGDVVVGEPGAVPHLGDLTADDLKQLSRLTETP